MYKKRVFWNSTGYNYWLLCLPILINIVGCNKLVEVPPPVTQLTSPTVYKGDGTAASVLTGLYTKMSSSQFSPGGFSLSVNTGLLADELQAWPTYTNALVRASYTNQLFATTQIDYCTAFYPYIYITNTAIENLEASTMLTPIVKQHLLGEAKFSRAFCYFYLVNLYGPVPLTTTSNYVSNSLLAKSSVTDVYQQVINDLKDAQQLLSDDYMQADAMSVATNRLRPNKGAATALLARAYLYTGDWAKSEEQASLLINDSTRYHLTGLNDVFLKTSSEAIWQLQAINDVSSTDEAMLFLLSYGGPNDARPFYLSEFLLQASEPGDQRSVDWINYVTLNGIKYYYPTKYKEIVSTAFVPTSEASTVLRLAEQYLIRAEARAHQGNIEGSQDDLNAVRNRSNLPNTSASTSEDLVAAILRERQIEFFTEYGHRWLDLKRTNTINAVMQTVTPAKGGNAWQPYQQWLPFTVKLLEDDAALTQNEGY